MAEEKLSFQAEVTRLLDIVVHSLYSQREIFLRELISNASDACDKLRYAALTEPDLIAGDADFRIELTVDADAGTLTIADNGVGMNRDELIENLGTIAKSGTGAFINAMSGDARKDMSLIGQFGVGFYSAFMVADTVSVESRKAGEDHGWTWTSDGKGSFTVADAPDATRGARITMTLKEDAREFLETQTLRKIVKTYSDHIGLPVILKGETDETLNSASALWTRSKSEITEEQYREFYHHVGHAFDDPWLTIHYRAEGAIEYTGLLFIPSQPPFDMFNAERKSHVKLYVNRVFITDDAEGLLPPYLRFLRGVVDSADLPLNVSREMLQHQPLLRKMQSGLVKRVIGDLKKKAADDAEGYATFWESFGAVFKEGLYEDFERRDDLLSLARFRSTRGAGLVSLAEYVEAMKDGQDAIYYITGENADALAASPVLEGFRAKGIEVLLLTDTIDEFWTSMVPNFDGKAFTSAAQGAADLSKIADGDKTEDDAAKPEAAPAEQMDALVAALKLALGEAVKEVRPTDRLTSSPCCLVAEAGGPSLHLERLLRQQQGAPAAETGRILEVNPTHALIRHMAEKAASDGTKDSFGDLAHLLLDQARIVEGEAPADPLAFARRLSAVMEKGLPG